MPPPICPAPTTRTCSNATAAEGNVGAVAHVDVNGARLWVEEAGEGPAVVLIHGGLGDLRLWEPEVPALAERFRVVRYDLRFWGRSESPGVEFSSIDDLIGVLDAVGIERAAVAGLSLGGALALDAVLAHPDRFWALVHVAGGVSGMDVNPYTPEQEAVFEGDDLEAMLAADMAVWAPLGVTDLYRDLWRVTPDARGIPDGAEPRPRPDPRLEDVAVPTLVVVAEHDPPGLKAVAEEVARR